MTSLLPFVLSAMHAVAPTGDHHVLAEAISTVVASERPLFKDDDERRRTSSLLVAIAFRESSFHVDAVGDCDRMLAPGVCAPGSRPHSFGAFQIHESIGGTKALLTDPAGSVRLALRILRWSLHSCPAHPVANYAEGPHGCTSKRAQRISADRMALARYVARRAAAEVVSLAPRGLCTPIGAAFRCATDRQRLACDARVFSAGPRAAGRA